MCLFVAMSSRNARLIAETGRGRSVGGTPLAATTGNGMKVDAGTAG